MLVPFQFDTFYLHFTKAQSLNMCSFAEINVEFHTQDEAVPRCIRVCFCFLLLWHLRPSSFFIIQSRYIGQHLPTLAGMSLQVRRRVMLELNFTMVCKNTQKQVLSQLPVVTGTFVLRPGIIRAYHNKLWGSLGLLRKTVTQLLPPENNNWTRGFCVQQQKM